MRLAIVAIVLGAASGSASADRVASRTRCQALTQSQLVFVGRVDKVVEAGAGRFDVTFTVRERLRGTPASTITLASGRGATCDGLLAVGGELLVTGWGVHAWCGDARRLEDAAADIALVRDFGKHDLGYVDGKVTLNENPHRSGAKVTPRAGLEVRVPHTSYSTRTAADGTYRLALPPGKHRIQLVEPDGKLAASAYTLDPKSVDVHRASCATRDFMEVWNGRIRGRIVDHRGKPAAEVRVHAIESTRKLPFGRGDTFGPMAVTDFDGYYEIVHVPAGSYHVAVGVPFETSTAIPGTFYPGAATQATAKTVTVGRGDLVSEISFKLREPRPMAHVVAVVASRAVRSNVTVRLTNLAEKRVTEHDLSTGGDIELTEEIGARVTLQACETNRHPAACGPLVTFVVDPARPRITIDPP
jgi:hypothetical protein